MRLIRVGVLAVYAALTIMGAAGLADAGGWWPWTAGLMLAAVIVESSVLSRTPLRGALRVGRHGRAVGCGRTDGGGRAHRRRFHAGYGGNRVGSLGWRGTPGMWERHPVGAGYGGGHCAGAATVGFESLRSSCRR